MAERRREGGSATLNLALPSSIQTGIAAAAAAAQNTDARIAPIGDMQLPRTSVAAAAELSAHNTTGTPGYKSIDACKKK